MVDDGVNSARRYFVNNFKDPRYQKSLDILLGKAPDDVYMLLDEIRKKIAIESAENKKDPQTILASRKRLPIRKETRSSKLLVESSGIDVKPRGLYLSDPAMSPSNEKSVAIAVDLTLDDLFRDLIETVRSYSSDAHIHGISSGQH